MAIQRPASALTPGLRPAAPEDADLICAWLGDPARRRYLSSNLRIEPLSPTALRAGLRRKDQLWSLFLDDAGRPIGLIALDSIDPIDGVANFWYLLGDSGLAGRGWTSAAITRFLSANPAGLRLVNAWSAAPNIASLRCLARCGFREIGRVSGAFVDSDGSRHDRILFERTLG